MNSKTRQKLRKEAQSLKAKIQIGQNGLNEEVLKSIDQMFNTNELLKVKVNRADIYDKTIVRDYAEQISSALNCDVVYVVGTTITLYRYNDKLHKN